MTVHDGATGLLHLLADVGGAILGENGFYKVFLHECDDLGVLPRDYKLATAVERDSVNDATFPSGCCTPVAALISTRLMVDASRVNHHFAAATTSYSTDAAAAWENNWCVLYLSPHPPSHPKFAETGLKTKKIDFQGRNELSGSPQVP